MEASYITPAVTLFKPDGMLDMESQKSLYEHLICCGIDGILVQGSIGEFFAMPLFQRMQLAKISIETIAHRTRCIIGTSSMVMDEIAPFSNSCLDMGADAVMIIPPYYFPFDDEALFRFYDRLLTEIHGFVYLYNFPDRTGYTISPEVILRLAHKHGNLKGIKDSISGLDHTREIIKTVKSEFPQFEVYSGFDDNAVHNILSGGNGVIGGLSNIVPEICAEWIRAIRENDLHGIAAGQQKIDRLMDIYFIGSLFVSAIKAGVKLREIVSSDICTFPMPAPTEDDTRKIAAILQREGIQI